MRAAVAPAVNARWMLQEVPRPVPGPNQVLIRIHASGICFTDVHQTHGHLPGEFPRILGHETVGEIVELGPGVVTRKVGDRVGVPWVQTTDGRCEWCLRGRPMFCPNAISTGTQAQGGHAEFMPAHASATMLIPDSVSYEQAAPVSALATRYGADCAGPTPSPASASPSWESAAWATSPSNTPKLRA
jgi:D-arabinose 1-dehydrogenase-like Zn-dependent alcohol dehydrogenase